MLRPMKRPAKRSFAAEISGGPMPPDIDKRIASLFAKVERNKTRRRRDDDPPAALPAPIEPRPRGGGFTGGAAAALVFED
jgi:hypothetical protein